MCFRLELFPTNFFIAEFAPKKDEMDEFADTGMVAKVGGDGEGRVGGSFITTEEDDDDAITAGGTIPPILLLSKTSVLNEGIFNFIFGKFECIWSPVGLRWGEL